MIKKLLRIAVCGAVLCALCTSIAFADGEITATRDDSGVVTVTVGSLNGGEETTLLVVPQGVTVSDAFEDTAKIYHMDQAPAADTGVATFNFKYTGTDNLYIYSGYTTMAPEDKPYDGVLDLTEGTDTPQQPGDAEIKYGDVNNDGKVNVLDASAVINHVLRGSAFLDSATKEEYEYGALAADVDGNAKINVLDASTIISHFLRGTEFPVAKNNN